MNEILIYVLLILAGFFSGVLNTLASSGSAVVLPFLIFLGIDPSVANGTNRVALLLGFGSATITLARKNLIEWPMVFRTTPAIVLGTLAGAYLAGIAGSAHIQLAIICAVVMSFVLILANPKKLLSRMHEGHRPYKWYHHLLFFAIGVWAGFIVLDSASFLLFAFVMGLGYDLIRGNSLKNALGTVIGIVSLLVFASDGEVNWLYGALLSVGSIAGSVLSGRYAAHEKAKAWIFRLLIAVIVLELVRMIYVEAFAGL